MKWLIVYCLTSILLLNAGFAYASPSYNYEVSEEAAFIVEDDFSLPAALVVEQNNTNSVQVFDVKKGKVVLTTENNEQFQKFAHQWLKGIKSFAPEVQPDMTATYIFRIPMNPPATLQIGSTNLHVAEIFMFYYADKEPLLLIFDENKKPYLFHTSEDVTPFVQYISIPE